MATQFEQGRALAPPIPLPPILAFALGVPAAPRSAVEAVIEKMIAALDEIDRADGTEADGDEQDGTDAEDETPTGWALRNARYFGPGCPIADEDHGRDGS